MRLFSIFVFFLKLFIVNGLFFQCPNNDQCFCQIKLNKPEYDINCYDFDVFPPFTSYNFSGYNVNIYVYGSVNYIPENSLVQIQAAETISLQIQCKTNPQISINISQNAFDGLTCPVDLDLVAYQFTSIPTDSIAKLNGFSLNSGSLTSVQSGAFSGFSGQVISLYSNGPTTVDQNAFVGLHPIQSFTFNNGNITDMGAFKLLKTNQMQLADNNIATLQNYTFCECNNFTCPNAYLQSLDLQQNTISSIEYNAFANLPNLTKLNLEKNKLSSVPGALDLVPSLTSLTLERNLIKTIEANSFYSLQLLQSLDININPITVLEPGAFNGLNSMVDLNIQNVNLTELDLLVVYGMNNVRSFELSDTASPFNVTLSDYTKLPNSLQSIFIGSTPVASITPVLELWLNENSTHQLNLGVNKDFICNPSIRWMTKYVFCLPRQITPGDCYCNGTSLFMIDYLSTLPISCQ